jgi:hypothetical protein
VTTRYVTLVASTAQTVVVTNGEPVLDEIADAPDRYLIPGLDFLEVVNVDGDDVVYFTYDFAAGFNAASAGSIPPAPTIAGAGTSVVPAEPGEYVRVRAPIDHNIAIVRAISAGTPRIGVSTLRHGGVRGDDDLGGGASHDYVPYAYDVTVTSPDTVIGALSPFGYWKLNDASGNPQDSSGNGNHATAAHATVTYAQAPLSAKAGNSIALSGNGGRLHFPTLVATTMGDLDEAFTITGLAMFTTSGLPNGNGVIWISESQANTVALWGMFLRNDLSVWLPLMNQTVKGITPPGFYPPLNTPFVFGIRAAGLVQDIWINGVLIATQFRIDDGATGVGWDLGMNLGDSFFGSPAGRYSNIAAWTTALTDAQMVAVAESLMDATITAGAYSP